MTTDPNPATSSPDRAASRANSWLKRLGAAVAIVALVIFGRPILRALLPAPRLAPALKLVNEGRYPEAEAKLADYLDYDPSNAQARLFLARVMLDRDQPKPAEALETLEAIRPETATQAAEAQVLRGKALEALARPGQAEAAWNEALRIDPLVGEAGWLLLQLYYAQGREAESRALALRLSKNEPDPGDRVRLLLEPARFPAEPLAPSDAIVRFAKVAKDDPDNLRAVLAYYRAQAKEGTGLDESLIGLRKLVERFPEDLACRDAYLFAIAKSGDLDAQQEALAGLPPSLASSPVIAGHRGGLAHKRKDYAAAISELEKAVAASPSDPELLHLLGDAYRYSGRVAEAEATEAREAVVEQGRVELRGIVGKEQEEGRTGLFQEASSRRDLGLVPNPALYKRLADNRERMGHPDEALAWHELILKDDPDDPVSVEALARLAGTGG